MTASNRLACLKFTLQYEGGKVDNSADPGGRTNKGITELTYDEFRKSQGLAAQSVYLMTDQEMNEIYRQQYWDTIGGDTLPKGVDLALFDYAVNSGPARASKDFKSILLSETAHERIEAICNKRLSLMHGLSTWTIFGKGWTTRVAACEALAYVMAYGNAGGPVLPGQAIAAHKGDQAKKYSLAHGTASVAAGVAGAALTGISAHAHPGFLFYPLIAAVAASAIISLIFFVKAQQQNIRSAVLALK